MLLALCAENVLVAVEIPSQRPVTQSFDVFFELCLNIQFSKQYYVLYCTNKNKQDPLQI